MSTAATDDPVFIGGIAGAGKTRLGSLLGRHPHIAVTRKTYLWRNYYGRYGDLEDPANARRCATDILASPGVRRLLFDRDEFEQRMQSPPTSYGDLFGLVHRLHADAAQKPRWCDQLGLVEAYAEPIFATFPQAKMIHMVRDPRAPEFSRQKPGAVGWTIGKWVTSVDLAERNLERFGSRYLVVRYEDFGADEEATLKTVCRFLGEDFDQEIAQHTSQSRSPAGHPAPRSRRFIERCARDLMVRHGYDIATATDRATVRDRLVDDPANRLALETWKRIKVRAISKQVGGTHG